ncbi:ATP/GTP nucleotide-binding protein [Trypanosoma rangeli]|uniref:ATP/GTP nucleotide-binding protein n=1 Tax=Trypanosoma rangeli TaxID=5698 RepID=A0A422P2U5_TRYRA|nr:ATP/GTP nucleotide-binding protein [Trypanosoma rangeli]RNF12029.1 ATP/GTP nucleotide-binding protein [Trypanosoma rangeli]|eukprot:RNF12029.1 ATP/GTP nucleotide-binding protein [Trypanosoma rangeli]
MSSKYDRVKVRVHLGADHYYTLSRFMLSKMLTFCKLPTTVSVKVSLEVKKRFVDEERLEIAQAELQEATFLIMAQYGYGEAHAKLFPVMTRFYVERVPLVILIAGSGYCGKTAIAHSLGSRLNTHNVVSTDVLLETLTSVYNAFPETCICAGKDIGCQASWPQPDEQVLWIYKTDTEEEFVLAWRAWSEAIRPLVEEEVNKAITEGKVLILEGSLLSLAMYRPYLLRQFQRRHGAIVIAFYVSSDDDSRRFSVERFLASFHTLLPTSYRNNQPAAVAWMMRRLEAVEAIESQCFGNNGGGGGMQRRWISSKRDGSSMSATRAAGDGNEVRATDGETGLSSSAASPGAESPEGTEETVQVHCVTFSVERPSEPPEVMQDLVLERIMLELRQRQSLV